MVCFFSNKQSHFVSFFFEQDSESDECEETEEEFLERYAKVAAELEDSEVIEEADEEDDDHEIDLGKVCSSQQDKKQFIALFKT